MAASIAACLWLCSLKLKISPKYFLRYLPPHSLLHKILIVNHGLESLTVKLLRRGDKWFWRNVVSGISNGKLSKSYFFTNIGTGRYIGFHFALVFFSFSPFWQISFLAWQNQKNVYTPTDNYSGTLGSPQGCRGTWHLWCSSGLSSFEPLPSVGQWSLPSSDHRKVCSI